MRPSRRLLLSLHAIFIFLLLGAFVHRALAQTPGPPSSKLPLEWSEAVDSVVKKIAAAAGSSHQIYLDVKNISSLSSADFLKLRNALQGDLASRQLLLRPTASVKAESTMQVQVTLSEGVGGYVWIIQIPRAETQEVTIVPVPKNPASASGKGGVGLSLLQRMIWNQPKPILDFVTLTPDANGGPAILVILGPEDLEFYRLDDTLWKLEKEVLIPRPGVWPRDLRGRIDASFGMAILPGVGCMGDFRNPESVKCVIELGGKTAPRTRGSAGTKSDESEFEDALPLGPICADKLTALGTGAGDWTQPDYIQAYFLNGKESDPVGQPLHFQGPIFVMWPSEDGKSTRVISRNLQTGMYEASIVSVSCSD